MKNKYTIKYLHVIACKWFLGIFRAIRSSSMAYDTMLRLLKIDFIKNKDILWSSVIYLPKERYFLFNKNAFPVHIQK